MKISDIKIEKRYRKYLGDLPKLAASISKQGLIHQIAITEDNILIAGYRRLRAVKDILGWTDIDARVINVTSLVEGEHDENDAREDLTPSEKVELKQAVEREIGRRGGRPPNGAQPIENIEQRIPGDRPEFPPGVETREFAAHKAGFSSGRTARRAETVVTHGVPSLVEAMDEGKIAIEPASKIAGQPKKEQDKLLQQHMDKTEASIKEIREYITANPNTTVKEITRKLHIGKEKANRIRRSLSKAGIIPTVKDIAAPVTVVGNRKRGLYYIDKKLIEFYVDVLQYTADVLDDMPDEAREVLSDPQTDDEIASKTALLEYLRRLKKHVENIESEFGFPKLKLVSEE